jgi:hypothetical protein
MTTDDTRKQFAIRLSGSDVIPGVISSFHEISLKRILQVFF